jgi:hypothetical protein
VHRCQTIRCLTAEKCDLCISGVQAVTDEIERAANRDEGYEPDNPDVVAALDPVRAELAAIGNWSRLIALARTARPACEAAVNA